MKEVNFSSFSIFYFQLHSLSLQQKSNEYRKIVVDVKKSTAGLISEEEVVKKEEADDVAPSSAIMPFSSLLLLCPST